ncbi:MAG: bifunctional aldolase/short-chain dehydrogenase [Acidobacteriaceae bacterium]
MLLSLSHNASRSLGILRGEGFRPRAVYNRWDFPQELLRQAAEMSGKYGSERGLIKDRVLTSRLLGKDKTLVLHGGGNTSVKVTETDVFGNEEEILYVKGSGWDLETIQEHGFAPVRLRHLQRLAELPALSDPKMVNELLTHMTSASAPTPSVEAILHAIIPYRFVDHTHADAIVTITNTEEGEERIRSIYGDAVIIVPYVMPGFDLARACAERLRGGPKPGVIGMILMNHGVFSFGDTAMESYDRMIHLVGRAEAYLRQRQAWDVPVYTGISERSVAHAVAVLRKDISAVAGKPLIVSRHADPKVMAFVSRTDLSVIANRGPATPDHIIRTKRVPMIGVDVKAYADAYRRYFSENEPKGRERKAMLDPAPRVVLDPQLGMCAVGASAKDASIVSDIYSHTMDIIQRAEALGGYRVRGEKDLFEVEYWDLEQAKLRKSGDAPELSGEVAVVTGAASGIGRASVDALLRRGAAVVGLDISPEIVQVYERPDFLGLVCDVTDEARVRKSLEQGIERFGGLDMLVLNAGIFPGGRKISDLDIVEWRKVMSINLDANLALLREAYPFLKLSPRFGRVVIIGSKNVMAPGPGAAAYSASKAALNQLARIAALEWAGDGIRINSVHPNAVFDTGIWTDEVLAARSRHYGLSIDEYRRNNLLKTEIKSQDVAELVAEMCGPRFSKTTGAQIPVDGGNARVI